MKRVLQLGVRVYQMAISPMLGGHCRFTPTCSCYMHEALARHGAAKGLLLGAWRILKCNPWVRSGWVDDVPDAFAWRDIFGYKPRNKRH